MDAGTLGAISTLLVAAAFAGVCWWAFAPRRKKRFEDAADLPFKDDANDPDTADSVASSEADDSEGSNDRAEQDQTRQNDSSRRDEQ